jgi:integrase
VFKLLASPTVPNLLRSPVLVDTNQLPRYWVTVWSTLTSADAAPATQSKKLRGIENLYQHVDTLYGCGALDDALGRLDEQRLAAMLESWFITIRNRPNVTDADETRWQTGLTYVTSIVTWLSSSTIPNKRLHHIEARLHRLSHLYRQLHVRRRRQPASIRSLPANVAQTLYAMLDPASINNPFSRKRTRWLTFISFVLMLHQGLRRGELLLLTADTIKSAFDQQQQRTRYWLNVRESPYEETEDDPRYSRPGIKTAHSIRQLPVSEAVATLVQSYVENYRGKPNHAFLLNSQKNAPLSTESLTKVFAKISAALPTVVLKELTERTGKTSVTPHDLRHTCAVVRLNQLLKQGDSMDEALQKLRAFFGWSRESLMPVRYARAVFEDRLSSVWCDMFDEQVEMMRAIP